jgi:hypothetical protein
VPDQSAPDDLAGRVAASLPRLTEELTALVSIPGSS